MRGQRGKLEEGGVVVEETLDPIPDEELVAGLVEAPRALRPALLDRLHLGPEVGHELLHPGGLGPIGVVVGAHLSLDDAHSASS